MTCRGGPGRRLRAPGPIQRALSFFVFGPRAPARFLAWTSPSPAGPAAPRGALFICAWRDGQPGVARGESPTESWQEGLQLPAGSAGRPLRCQPSNQSARLAGGAAAGAASTGAAVRWLPADGQALPLWAR
jgi:hypothetical protein